jgi:hypothetical protein
MCDKEMSQEDYDENLNNQVLEFGANVYWSKKDWKISELVLGLCPKCLEEW